MKTKFYSLLLLLFLFGATASAQPCSSFSATAETAESRCAATGKIIITATGGSGTYNYAVNGPVSTPYTSSNIIDGLPAGIYTVFVKDVGLDCFFSINDVIVEGSYQDPRFELTKKDVTCINGNNGSISVTNVQFGRPAFSYTIVAPSTYGVGTTSATGEFTNLVPGSYYIQQLDSCGGIQTRNISVLNYNWFIDAHTVTRVDCDSADVFIGLKDIYGKVNTVDSVFKDFKYGVVTPSGDTTFFDTYNFRILLGSNRNLTLFAIDNCGELKKIIWLENRNPRVATAVSEINKACDFFSAKITGQQYLTNPSYCLYDSLNTLISCNSTGQFDSLAYGSYCIRITDICYDTTINRCFTAVKPIPSVAANVTVTYGDDCSIVTVSISGTTNLFNPQFCLYDSADVLISCNTTGTFGNVPVGSYCMKITGSICNDTTLIRCFNVVPLPVGPGTGPEFSDFTCATFTGKITGTNGLGNANYCLYDSANVLIKCNTTGVFDSLSFGSYCITIEVSRLMGGCADTLLTRCFTVNKPMPSADDPEIIKTCSTFTAAINSVQNISSPSYCLYSGPLLIACNTTGSFTDLSFGSYCIGIKDSCTDSTIYKCFTVAPDSLQIRGTALPSCNLGQTKIRVRIDTGIALYRYELYNASDSLLQVITSNQKQVEFDNLPALDSGQQYRILVIDACGDSTSLLISPDTSFINNSKRITRNCPGGSFTQGSSDAEFTLVSNLAKVTPVIIKKNGTSVTINYTFSNTSQTVFTFKNLEPATYIFRSSVNNSCGIKVYDTITITSYEYPSLQNSNLYRCDDNSTSITAATSGGIAPNMYEIIGSFPSSPSIISAPQPSPAFTINNGTAYTLVRLRVMDACGNASINDISVVPLVNILATTQGGCFDGDVTMQVNEVPGATYNWYRKNSAADSTLIGNTPSYYIPVVRSADTGTYLCKITLGNSCITRLAYYNLTGFCLTLLDNTNIKLNLKKENSRVHVQWNVISETGISHYVVERKRENETMFTTINTQAALFTNGNYSIIDENPGPGTVYYRIRVMKENATAYYSKTALIKNQFDAARINIYPNPVQQIITVELNNKEQSEIAWKLCDLSGKVITGNKLEAAPNHQFYINRPSSVLTGMYLLYITNLKTHSTEIKKIIFR
jgi:Secretion system C-terminal sorting domain/SprB repeat